MRITYFLFPVGLLFSAAVLFTAPKPPAPSTTENAAYRSATLPPLLSAPKQLPPLASEKPELFHVSVLPPNFDARAINNKGEIAGIINRKKAAVYIKGSLRVLPTVYTVVNQADDPPLASVTAFNNALVAAGSSGKFGSGAITYEYRDAALWDAAKFKGRSIGCLPHLSYAMVTALNDRKQAVGLSRPSSALEIREDTSPDLSGPVEQSNAFFWDGRKMLDLGRGAAFGLNNRGQVVGTQNGQIMLWQENQKRVLGDGGGKAINNRGQILADPTIGNAELPHASLPQAVLLYKNTRTPLGILPGGTRGEAESLNDRGEVVGVSECGASKENHAFLWRAGKMYDLNAHIPSSSGWILREAQGINNRGQIIGSGTFHGKKRDFLLTPR